MLVTPKRPEAALVNEKHDRGAATLDCWGEGIEASKCSAKRMAGRGNPTGVETKSSH